MRRNSIKVKKKLIEKSVLETKIPPVGQREIESTKKVLKRLKQEEK